MLCKRGRVSQRGASEPSKPIVLIFAAPFKRPKLYAARLECTTSAIGSALDDSPRERVLAQTMKFSTVLKMAFQVVGVAFLEVAASARALKEA